MIMDVVKSFRRMGKDLQVLDTPFNKRYLLNGDDYNVYHKGKLIARERNGLVKWVK